jgi:hypothetical protein
MPGVLTCERIVGSIRSGPMTNPQHLQGDGMFTTEVPTYRIDLGRDEPNRWEEVISREKTAANRLVQEAARQFDRVPELLRWVFARLYQRFGGLYRGEIESWAEALGVSLGTVNDLELRLRVESPAMAEGLRLYGRCALGRFRGHGPRPKPRLAAGDDG